MTAKDDQRRHLNRVEDGGRGDARGQWPSLPVRAQRNTSPTLRVRATGPKCQALLEPGTTGSTLCKRRSQP